MSLVDSRQFPGVAQFDGADVEFEDLLNRLDPSFSPTALRELATSLLRLADSIDQNWNQDEVRSNYPMFSKAARIERNVMPLAFSATKEEHRAKILEEAIGVEIIGVPAWNILLELFKQSAGGAKVSTKSLQLIARCPETTALRIIDRLEHRGFVIRAQSTTDKRVTFIALTRDGLIKVGSVLERLSD